MSAHGTGELILITNQASLTDKLAKFDISWFISSLLKHRVLPGEVLLMSFSLQAFALFSSTPKVAFSRRRRA